VLGVAAAVAGVFAKSREYSAAACAMPATGASVPARTRRVAEEGQRELSAEELLAALRSARRAQRTRKKERRRAAKGGEAAAGEAHRAEGGDSKTACIRGGGSVAAAGADVAMVEPEGKSGRSNGMPPMKVSNKAVAEAQGTEAEQLTSSTLPVNGSFRERLDRRAPRSSASAERQVSAQRTSRSVSSVDTETRDTLALEEWNAAMDAMASDEELPNDERIRSRSPQTVRSTGGWQKSGRDKKGAGRRGRP